jgi:hypothetical protein
MFAAEVIALALILELARTPRRIDTHTAHWIGRGRTGEVCGARFALIHCALPLSNILTESPPDQLSNPFVKRDLIESGQRL